MKKTYLKLYLGVVAILVLLLVMFEVEVFKYNDMVVVLLISLLFFITSIFTYSNRRKK